MRGAAKKPEHGPDLHWECGWDEHEEMQLRRMANLSFAEKLEWLEDAHQLVLQLQGSQSEHCENALKAVAQDCDAIPIVKGLNH
jgi:hypothetical protein